MCNDKVNIVLNLLNIVLTLPAGIQRVGLLSWIKRKSKTEVCGWMGKKCRLLFTSAEVFFV